MAYHTLQCPVGSTRSQVTHAAEMLFRYNDPTLNTHVDPSVQEWRRTKCLKVTDAFMTLTAYFREKNMQFHDDDVEVQHLHRITTDVSDEVLYYIRAHEG